MIFFGNDRLLEDRQYMYFNMQGLQYVNASPRFIPFCSIYYNEIVRFTPLRFGNFLNGWPTYFSIFKALSANSINSVNACTYGNFLKKNSGTAHTIPDMEVAILVKYSSGFCHRSEKRRRNFIGGVFDSPDLKKRLRKMSNTKKTCTIYMSRALPSRVVSTCI